jgi:hypothetical protein
MDERLQVLSRVLEGLSEQRVRELCIEAIRSIRRRPGVDHRSTIKLDMHTILQELGPMVGHKEWAGIPPPLGDTGLNEIWAEKLLSFVAWLERSGFAFVLGRGGGGADNAVRAFRLLPAGQAFFALQGSDHHPALPGWLDRLVRRCPGIDDELVGLLDDANRCREPMLHRAAVTLLGVAFESVVLTAYEALVSRGLIAAPPPPPARQPAAAARITAIRGAIGARYPRQPDGSHRELQGKAERACDFADQLRDRRNNAAHATAPVPFNDPEEVEQFLFFASHHLPSLWDLGRP